MVRHAPIHRRSGHSDIAICCGRNVRGSSPSTSLVPLSNQVTTLNHKRFKGFKMFSDGHLDIFTGKTTWRVNTVLHCHGHDQLPANRTGAFYRDTARLTTGLPPSTQFCADRDGCRPVVELAG